MNKREEIDLKNRVFHLERRIAHLINVSIALDLATSQSPPTMECEQCNLFLYEGHSCSHDNCMNGLNKVSDDG